MTLKPPSPWIGSNTIAATAARFDVGLEDLRDGLLHVGQRRVRVGEGRVVDLGREGPEAGLVGLHLAGQRDREQAAAVERAVEGDHAGAFGVITRDLDRVFDRLGTGREQRGLLLVAARRQGVELLGQRDVALVGHDLVAGVRVALELRGDRTDHLRVAVAGVHHRDAAGEVDVAVAFDVPEFGVVGTVGEERAHHADATRRRGGLAGHQLFVLGVVHGVAPPVEVLLTA